MVHIPIHTLYSCTVTCSMCIIQKVFLTPLHFNKYSGGAPTISEEDFARILLRHTSWDMDSVFARIRRVPPINREVCREGGGGEGRGKREERKRLRGGGGGKGREGEGGRGEEGKEGGEKKVEGGGKGRGGEGKREGRKRLRGGEGRGGERERGEKG